MTLPPLALAYVTANGPFVEELLELRGKVIKQATKRSKVRFPAQEDFLCLWLYNKHIRYQCYNIFLSVNYGFL